MVSRPRGGAECGRDGGKVKESDLVGGGKIGLWCKPTKGVCVTGEDGE